MLYTPPPIRPCLCMTNSNTWGVLTFWGIWMCGWKFRLYYPIANHRRTKFWLLPDSKTTDEPNSRPILKPFFFYTLVLYPFNKHLFILSSIWLGISLKQVKIIIFKSIQAANSETNKHPIQSGGMSAPIACLHTQGSVWGGMCPLQKLENFVFLQLKSCNLVNTFRHIFRAGGGKKHSSLRLTDQTFAFWEKFLIKILLEWLKIWFCLNICKDKAKYC